MYTYELYFVNYKGERKHITWNCTCSDYDTTYKMAKGTCNRLNAVYGAITIRKANGEFVDLHWFDKVLY